jgi:hypothetical protein
VVGRFIQQQQVGVGQQYAGQRQAGFLPAAQVGDRRFGCLIRQAEGSQGRRAAPGILGGCLQALQCPVIFGLDGGLAGILTQLGRQFGETLGELLQVALAMLDVALDGFTLCKGCPLRQVTDPDVGGIKCKTAAICPLRAGQDAQQGGFAARRD